MEASRKHVIQGGLAGAVALLLLTRRRRAADYEAVGEHCHCGH